MRNGWESDQKISSRKVRMKITYLLKWKITSVKFYQIYNPEEFTNFTGKLQLLI